MNRRLNEAIHNVEMNKRQRCLSYHDNEMTTAKTTIIFSVHVSQKRKVYQENNFTRSMVDGCIS